MIYVIDAATAEKRLLSDSKIHEFIVNYDANIRFVDDNLRELFRFLETRDLVRKSIIIITADHGESLGEHDILSHTELYYGILRVPLILKIPHSKGGIIAYPISLIDIFPTILSLLGYNNDLLKLNLRGRNLFEERTKDEIQFSEYRERYSIIMDNWRIFLNKEGNYEFYNLKDDPQELNNLVAAEKGKFKSLKYKLDEYIKQKQVNYHKIIEPILTEDVQERLKSLGYLQ